MPAAVGALTDLVEVGHNLLVREQARLVGGRLSTDGGSAAEGKEKKQHEDEASASALAHDDKRQ